MPNNIVLPSSTHLSEVKQHLRDNWNEGVECPACTQFVKVYKRQITSSMAYALILLYKYFQNNTGREWVHMNDYLNSLDIPFPVKSGDNAKLRYWGLIEEKPLQRVDKSKRAGFWKLTELGREFVRGEAKVQFYAKVFNSKCYGLVGDLININTALGNKFNYSELMSI